MALENTLRMAAQPFLVFQNVWLIAVLFCVGYFSSQRSAFCRSLLLCLGVMTWNHLLKGLFQAPLLPHLGTGWAFPSGHVHFGMIFWGWLAWDINHRGLWIAVALMLPIVGLATIMAHYHTVFEIFGACLFSLVELVSLVVLTSFFPRLKNPCGWIMLTGTVILGCLIYFLGRPERIGSFLWTVWGIAIGLSAAWLTDRKSLSIFQSRKDALSVLIGLSFSGILFYSFHRTYSIESLLPFQKVIFFSCFLFIALSIPSWVQGKWVKAVKH